MNRTKPLSDRSRAISRTGLSSVRGKSVVARFERMCCHIIWADAKAPTDPQAYSADGTERHATNPVRWN